MSGTRPCLRVALLLIGLLFVFSAEAKQDKTDGDERLTFTFDLTNRSKKIKNTFSDINLWEFQSGWLKNANSYPDDYFKKNYPFVNNIQFMTATGGVASRDLFINPTDTTIKNDYKFDELIAAVRGVVKKGLKPMIKTGNVPIKFSTSPKLGVFGVNTRPPDDYNLYYDYIKALATALVREFGINEVKTWSWGVLTEYENKDWFWVKDEDPAASKIYYFKLYDYTVAALEDVIGPENLKVGAHSMTVVKGSWDELEFIDHVAKGINYKTGKRGTQIDFLCASYYDQSPGVTPKDQFTLSQCIQHLRDRAVANGLINLQYGIDEGRLLRGPKEDSRDLWSRVIGHSYQGAADARTFKTMLDIDADWFSAWGLTTSQLWGGVVTVATHVANLGYRLVDSFRLNGSSTGKPKDATNQIDAIGGVDPTTGTARFMIYNYNPSLHAASIETPAVVIKNLISEKGKKVSVKQWIVDDTHGNYWPTWWKDLQAQGLDKNNFSWSMYSVDVPANLLKQPDKDFWHLKEPSYKKLAELHPTTVEMPVRNNTITLQPTLTHHAVVFYEITGLKKR
jgi:hypothetical protein